MVHTTVESNPTNQYYHTYSIGKEPAFSFYTNYVYWWHTFHPSYRVIAPAWNWKSFGLFSTCSVLSATHTYKNYQIQNILDFSVRVVYWVLPTRTRITKFKISYNTYWAVLYTRFDCKVLVIDSNIKIVMIEGEEKSKHTQKRRKTNSRRRAKEQMQRSKEQPSNITVQHQLYCYTLSYYIIWYSSRSGVEWHFKFLKTR